MSDTRTVKTAFDQLARWYPTNEAFVQAFADDDRRYTYDRANTIARRFAHALADLGVEKGDRIAFVTKTTAEHAIYYFGAMKLGAIPVNVHIREATNVMAGMLETIDPSVLLFHPHYADRVEATQGRYEVDHVVSFTEGAERPALGLDLDSLMDGAPTDEPDVEVVPGDPAIICFSSGTSGPPKPIVHTHEELVESAHHSQYIYSPRHTDRYLNNSPPSTIGWLISQLPFVNTGATLVMLDEWDPKAVLEVTESERLTVVTLVPTQWEMVMQEDVEAFDLGSIRRIAYSGEPISVPLFEQLKTHVSDDVMSIYGSSETLASGTVLLPMDVSASNLGSVGKPVPNTELRIVDPDHYDPEETLDPGDVGEVIIRGPAVSKRGIWNDPSKSAEMFHEDGWWFSGDLGRVDESNEIYLEGRKNEMIISGGFNISPYNVEDVLRKHPRVLEVVVIGVPHETWGETPKAFVVAEGDLTADEVDEWLKQNDDLADYKRPREYEFLDEIPMNQAGKADRSALHERESGGSA